MMSEVGIISFREGLVIPNIETRQGKIYRSEATLKKMKRYTTTQDIKGDKKRFIESIEIGPHVVRNFVSTVVHETDFRPFTCVSGVTIQICQLGKEAVPNDKALLKNVIKVWSKPSRL